MILVFYPIAFPGITNVLYLYFHLPPIGPKKYILKLSSWVCLYSKLLISRGIGWHKKPPTSPIPLIPNLVCLLHSAPLFIFMEFIKITWGYPCTLCVPTSFCPVASVTCNYLWEVFAPRIRHLQASASKCCLHIYFFLTAHIFTKRLLTN